MRGNVYFRPNEEKTEELGADGFDYSKVTVVKGKEGLCKTPMVMVTIEDIARDGYNSNDEIKYKVDEIEGYDNTAVAIPYKLMGAGDRLLGAQNDGMWDVKWIFNNKSIVSAHMDGTIREWNVNKLQRSDNVMKGHKPWVNAIDCDNVNNVIVSGGQDGDVRVWKVNESSNGQSEIKLTQHFSKVHPITVKSIAISSDAKYVASGADDKQVQIRAIRT